MSKAPPIAHNTCSFLKETAPPGVWDVQFHSNYFLHFFVLAQLLGNSGEFELGKKILFRFKLSGDFFLFLKENNAERLLKEKQTAAGAGLVCMCHHPLSNSTARSTRRRSQT